MRTRFIKSRSLNSACSAYPCLGVVLPVMRCSTNQPQAGQATRAQDVCVVLADHGRHRGPAASIPRVAVTANGSLDSTAAANNAGPVDQHERAGGSRNLAATMRRASQDQILVDVTAFPRDRREARTGGTLLAHATGGQVSDERRAPDLALAGREAALLPPTEKPLWRCHHVSLARNATTCGRLIKNVIRARKGNIVNEPKKQKNTYIGKRRREEGGNGVVKDVGSQSVRDFAMLTCSQC